MIVFYNGRKYNLTEHEIIDLVRRGRLTAETEVEYKGKIRKLADFKSIQHLFEDANKPKEEIVIPPVKSSSAKENESQVDSSTEEWEKALKQAVDTPLEVDVDGFLESEKTKKKHLYKIVAVWLTSVILGAGVLIGVWGSFRKTESKPHQQAKKSQAPSVVPHEPKISADKPTEGDTSKESSKDNISPKGDSDIKKVQSKEDSEEDFSQDEDSEIGSKSAKELYKMAYSLMVEGEEESESCSELTYRVWYNSIHKESSSLTDKYTKLEGTSHFYDDFNLALLNLRIDEDFNKRIEKIKKNQEQVAEVMKTLQKRSRKDQNIYDLLLKQYQIYVKVSRLAVDPTGSLLEYGNECNAVKADFSDNLHMLELYIE